MNKIWLADFSDSSRIFTVIVVSEMMVIVYSLSFLTLDTNYLTQLAVLSLLAQLIAITLILIVAKTHKIINQFNPFWGVLILSFLTICFTFFYTQFLAWLDGSLNMGMAKEPLILSIKITIATLMTLLALLRYFYIQDQWAWQVSAHAKAEITALQARIKPHFLYNSLNSIASLITIDAAAAEKAVLNLSSLFRKAFSKKQNHIALNKELEWVNEYLAIEKLRFADRLQFTCQIDETLIDKQVPVLSLQPLIENAVLHGIEPSNQTGLITLEISQNHHSMIITITNPYHESHHSNGSGSALANIRKRLNLSYGNAAQLTTQIQPPFHLTQMTLPL